MSSITLNASFSKNASLQINDVIYYQDINGNTYRIGPLTSMSDTTVTTSGLLGYYAEIDFTNDSRDYAELFAVNSEIFISSN